MPFQPATREKAKLRMALMGPAKSGKTFTALRLATALAGDGKVAVIDTENGSASKYAGPGLFKFDKVELKNHHPKAFIEEIFNAHREGYSVVVIDSLSHEWMGNGGCLDLVEDIGAHSKSGNTFAPWKEVTPLHREVFEVINRAPMHVICTFRVKTEYSVQTEDGKMKPKKIGLAPVTRDGAEYEFDILMDMDKGVGYIDHTSRCPALQYMVIQHPGEELAKIIKNWLDGEDMGMPDVEERMTRVNSAPKPEGQKSDPRPSVPAEAAAKAPKSSSRAQGAKAASESSAAQTAPSPSTTSANAQSASTNTDPKSTNASGKQEGQTTNAISAKDAGNATSVPAVEAGVTAQSAQSSATSNGTPQTTPNKVGATEMGQLLQVAQKNGWNRNQVSEFVCFAFGLKLESFAQTFTFKQWEIAIKLLQAPGNANGQVRVTADGKPLDAKHHWPQSQAA